MMSSSLCVTDVPGTVEVGVVRQPPRWRTTSSGPIGLITAASWTRAR
jgi:hypothetical protein